MTLLRLEDVSLRLGERVLFEELTLAIEARDRLALVGRNGAGKSTLLSLLAGEIEPDAGVRWTHPRRCVFRLPQDPPRPAGLAAAAFLAQGWGAGVAGDARRAEPHEVARLLAETGIAADAALETLSGGAWRRLAIARALLAEADLLLLDEPTNHLDIDGIRWLEKALAAARRALVVVSHDRAFLERVTDACLWLESGRVHRLACGIADLPAHVEEVRRTEAERLAKLGRRIAVETRWAREGITARRKRNQGRLRRLARLRGERERLLARREGALALSLSGGEGKGARVVIEAERIVKRHGARTLIDGFSTRIMRGERIGIVGPNGAGKTTLVRILVGLESPDAGVVRRADGLRLLYFDQMRASLDPGRTLVETITDGTHDHVRVGDTLMHAVAWLERFLFRPEQGYQKVASLSGGERARLMLARALLQPADLLVLDEPTNDLDLETLDALESALAEYRGTVLLISHDRAFLDAVAGGVIHVHGDGRVSEHAGGLSELLRLEEARRGVSGSDPEKGGARRTERSLVRRRGRPPGGAGSAKASPAAGKERAGGNARALARLEEEIAGLEREIALLERALASPGAYRRSPEKFRLASERLGALKERLEECEERWLEASLAAERS